MKSRWLRRSVVGERPDHILIELAWEPLEINAAYRHLQDAACGGIALFAGTTRQWTGSHQTLQLEYDSYESMARRTLEELADDACRRWPVRRVCILHRLGIVPIAEASVVVGAAAPHRDAAFSACRFLIDRLKTQVPIWKREHLADGQTQWIEGTRPPDLDLS